jgi:hypothetical protein
MVYSIKKENRIIPYKMLHQVVSYTHELVEEVLPENGIPSLRIGLNHLKAVMEEYIRKAGEGLPIIGHHFSFPTEFL